MTNQDRYTVIESIYNNNGVFVIDVAADDTISSGGIVIDDGAQLFLILLSVAAGMNDVDSNLYTKIVAKYGDLTATLPATVWVDLKGANNNTNPSADASLFFITPKIYDDGTNPPQEYQINELVNDLLTNNTGITRVVSTDDVFTYLEQYKDQLLLEVLAVMYPTNYIVWHEQTNEYLIVEVI